jgi:hypothetical protein
MWVRTMKDKINKEIVKCVCGKWTKPKTFRIEGFTVRGSECPKCKESYLNGEDAGKLSEYRKIKDAIMEGKISTAGNSFVLRLPIRLIRALGLSKGRLVRISVRSPNEVLMVLN